MPRLISMAKTIREFENGSKTETRRDGWLHAEPGMVLQAVDRLPRAGAWRRLRYAGGFDLIRITAVERVRLGDITEEQVAAEGFPGMAATEFVALYCVPGPPDPEREVSRICFTGHASKSLSSGRER